MQQCLHNCWVTLGSKSALNLGSAKNSTLMSTESINAERANTANPSHSRRPALGASELASTGDPPTSLPRYLSTGRSPIGTSRSPLGNLLRPSPNISW